MWHIGVGPGQVHDRLILVGEEKRARLIAENLFTGPVEEFKSLRGFLTINGTYQSRPVTLMSIGMGYPMMDFALRELRAIIPGPMYVVRLGTCGLIKNAQQDCSYGCPLICDQGSAMIQVNFDDEEQDVFRISRSVYMPDPGLTEALKKEANRQQTDLLPSFNISADSFYASQGRASYGFANHNQRLLVEVGERFAEYDLISMEMETAQLMRLGRTAAKEVPVLTAAIHIVVADRTKSEMIAIDEHALRSRELQLARIILSTLSNY